jgi:hypothetical protein
MSNLKMEIQQSLIACLKNDLLPKLLTSLMNQTQMDVQQQPVLLDIHSTLMQVQFEQAEGSQLTNNLYFNWIRYQLHLFSTQFAFPYCHHVNQLLAITPWLDHFNENLSDLEDMQKLFFYQNVLLDHLRAIIESSSDMIKYIDIFGILATDFSKVATKYWPAEQSWVTTHATCYATEVYSVIGQYAALSMHDLAQQNIEQYMQSLPIEVVKFFPKSESPRKGKDKSKKLAAAGQRPGTESQLNNINDRPYIN